MEIVVLLNIRGNDTKEISFKRFIYFKSNCIYFLLIGYVEIFKSKYNLPNYRELDVFNKTGGHIGVVLFFAISGFLITILLEKEKQERLNSKISI
jgi:uncharacterized protein with PQ loop repeat